MKKIGSLVLVLVMALAMVACSDTNTVKKTSTNGSNAETSASEQSQTTQGSDNASVDVTLDTTGNFVFKYENVDILLGAEPTDILAKLGEPKSKLDVPSCAHDGTDYVYTYNNMVLTVYIATGSTVGYISDVRLTSDLVATPEGLEIGNSTDVAVSKYGDADKTTDSLWIYKRGTSQLMLSINNGKIISIEYQIP